MAQCNTLTTAEKAFVEELRVARMGTADENGFPTSFPSAMHLMGLTSTHRLMRNLSASQGQTTARAQH